MAASDSSVADLLKAVNDTSSKAAALWITFLSVLTYLAIAIATTTHEAILLGAPLKLPLIGTDVPLLAFYQAAPFMLLLLHLYVLVQLQLLMSVVRTFDDELRSADVIAKERDRLRAQLDK